MHACMHPSSTYYRIVLLRRDDCRCTINHACTYGLDIFHFIRVWEKFLFTSLAIIIPQAYIMHIYISTIRLSCPFRETYHAYYFATSIKIKIKIILFFAAGFSNFARGSCMCVSLLIICETVVRTRQINPPAGRTHTYWGVEGKLTWEVGRSVLL